MKWVSFLFLILICVLSSEQAYANTDQQESHNKEVVVLLHGIARTNKSMGSIQTVLEKRDYDVLSITYPSREKDIKAIAEHIHKTALTEAFWNKYEKVHFVTHSMGGLVARVYLDKHRYENLGRVIMLAPPNKGSEVADLIHDIPLYDWYYGPAGDQLTTEVQESNQALPYYELGIIAGKTEWPYFVAAFIVPGKSDGRVSVERTKLDGMKDHITLPATHTFIMDKPNVHSQILEFLENGLFKHD
jgi:pimeloyl-ACP methyl ester carboxylesterase